MVVREVVFVEKADQWVQKNLNEGQALVFVVVVVVMSVW